jgi:hypothetical protein
VPYKKNSKKVNAGSKLKGASTMTIGINQKLPVSVTVPPAKYGTAKGKKAIDSKIRLLPTSSSFVAQSGTDIIGKEVGTANVYAIAHNGNVKKVKVSVVDYAKPKSWMNLNRASAVANLIANQEANLTDIFAYFERHNDLSGHISLEDSGGIITENNINIIGIESQLLDLFGFSGMSSPSLYVCKDGVQLTFKTGYTVCWIALALQTDLSENIYNDLNGEGLKIAPHWCTGASYNPPI